MNDVASLIAALVSAGVDPALVGRVAAALSERQPVLVMDEAAERRRASDRERKANIRRKRQTSAESADAHPPSQTSSSSLVPGEEKKEVRSLRSLNARADPNWPSDAFEQLWAMYPNKVGKPKAEEALRKAKKRGFLFADIMAGLERYIAKTDDRQWCNPTTWINQQRWLDEPGLPPSRAGPGRSMNGQNGSSRGPHGGTLADGLEVARRLRDDLAGGGDLFVGGGGAGGSVPARSIPALGYRKC